jgi:hypothetical protein
LARGSDDDSSGWTETSASYSVRVAPSTFTDADIAYVRHNYVTLAQLCADRPETPDEVEPLIEQGLLPRPSYVLEDGTGFFPRDYFRLADEAGGSAKLREHFAARYRAANHALGAGDELTRIGRRTWRASTVSVCAK